MDLKISKYFKDNFNQFESLMHIVVRLYLLILLTFFLYRLSFLLIYGNSADLSNNLFDVFNAFFTGLRFDTTVALYGLLIPFFLVLSTLFVPINFLIVKKIILYYGFLLFFIFNLISVIDFYFFKFFQFHLNILFFGIVHDDTLAVLRSVWTDYPIIKIVLFAIPIMLLYWYILKIIIYKNYKNRIERLLFRKISFFSIIILYSIGLRGTLGTFPLQTENTIICENSFINSLTLNGVFALKTAISEKKLQNIDTNIEKRLKKNGFASAKEAIENYLGKKITEKSNLEDLLYTVTPKDTFLINNPPNIIFIQMESFGSYYLNFHSNSLNVLGSLEHQLDDCIVFKNFLSGTGGTIGSLEGLLVGSPLTPISQSTFMNCSLNSSVALPYQKAGYHTNFITSSELGWRNLDKFVSYQYFETIEGAEILLKNVKNSTRGEWGVYDEFLFERITQVLNQSNNKPQFIFAMTTTNHTPFELPNHYKPYSVDIPKEISDVLRTGKNIAIKNFTNYQYANDCLGRFIEQIKNSAYAENTIIAASGDHNTLQLFNFSDDQMLQKLGVPFILYVPKKYLKKSHIDTNRFGSHKDIFPTLFNLSLSDAKYLKTGINLLDTIDYDNFAIIDYNLAMNSKGFVNFQSEPLFYTWSKKNPKLLEPVNRNKFPGIEDLYQKARAYNAAISFFIQSDMKKCENNKKTLIMK